ncbi:hypothetical protein GARC_0715 [Paraglaciecola arctica BSs20135]|uniref:Uncharacterized protein n=1 Tax=Paraglaciecola arctica BSs20135 TaxID=493475 RepID=K6Y199_9ALTE|nr:hypothetical protein GARC_0715 [Paraglaciecola arctica BSs20135]
MSHDQSVILDLGFKYTLKSELINVAFDNLLLDYIFCNI